MDWDDLRLFLALARTRSLSRAARVLGVTQPTMGRRIAAFERRIGAKLVQRTPAGYRLTAAGDAVLSHAERMEHEALAVERSLAGRDAGLSGTVRITTSAWWSSYVLARIASNCAQRHPRILIELASEARWVSLPQRDADLAFRFGRFEQQGVVERKVARVGFGLYASAGYLEVHGRPDFGRKCEGHALVTLHDPGADIADVPWLAGVAAAARIAVRANARETVIAAAVAGAGMACLPRCHGDAIRELRRLDPPTEPPARNVWLGVHADTRSIPRVRAVAEFFTKALASMSDALDPA